MADGELKQPDPAQGRAARGLGLAIPKQAAMPNDSLLRDPRLVSDWIDALPMANIGETARQLYKILLDFNHFELADLVRARVVEMFRKPLDYISRNLYRHYVDAGAPLSTKSFKIAGLNRELNAELAVAYKITIERMLSGAAGKFDRKLLVISIHRAVHYLGKVLLQCHLTYTDPPAGQWREIHRLYAYAAHNHVHRIPIKTRFEDTMEVSTIEETYLSLLLLKMAGPDRLRQPQIQQLFAQTLRWAPLLKADSDSDEVLQDEGFLVDLSDDQPPRFGNFLESRPGQPLFLDLGNLLKHLRATLDKNDPDQNQLPRALIRQLISTWTRPAQRRHVRTRLNFEFVLQTGLTAIHQALAEISPPGKNEAVLPTPMELRRNRPGMPAPKDSLLSPDSFESSSFALGMPPTDTLTLDSFNTDSRLSFGANSLSIEPGESQFSGRPKPLKPEPSQPEPTKHVIRTLNESAGGYCVDWTSMDRPPRIKVDELVGVTAADTDADADAQYTLCTVRWLHLEKNRRLKTGMQIISKQVTAALLRSVDQSSSYQTNVPVKALLLSAGNDKSNTPPSLILSSRQFSVGHQLWLISQGQERLIRLTALAETNSAFTRYQFSMESRSPNGNEDNRSDDTDFDDLWHTL